MILEMPDQSIIYNILTDYFFSKEYFSFFLDQIKIAS